MQEKEKRTKKDCNSTMQGKGSSHGRLTIKEDFYSTTQGKRSNQGRLLLGTTQRKKTHEDQGRSQNRGRIMLSVVLG